MTIETKPAKRKEVRNLLLVMGSAVACALALALWMLYQYNPTGRYLAKNVLLSPQIMSQISYPETDPKTGATLRYVFDSFEFSYFDTAKKTWSHSTVKPEAYREFYQAVAEDVSILPISEEMRALFSKTPPTTLLVHMHQGGATDGKITFQEVDFAPGGDFYRIQLRVEAETWAYFFHPGIERYAKAVFYP